MPTSSSRPITSCQVCGSNELSSVLFLGFVPPVNDMQPVGEPHAGREFFPLELLRCEDCTLVQIGYEVDPSVLFPPDYPYRSGTTRILRENFQDLARKVDELHPLDSRPFVVDIGSNDGTLLRPFAERGARVLGVEPSRAAEDAQERGIPTEMDFFSKALALRLADQEGPAQVVTAANVFAHMPDIHEVVDGIVALLADDGIFVSESHYLVDLVDTLQYDTVYHEHLRYYTLHSLQALIQPHGLEIFRVERIPTHGGSVRAYAGQRGRRPVEGSVDERVTDEANRGFADGSALDRFRVRVARSKRELCRAVYDIRESGKSVVGIGAPSRASTLVTYTGLDHEMLERVLEVPSSPKLGHYLPGTRIPVEDETRLYEEQPDYALLLSWHIADELMANLRSRGFGGRFIVPLPTPELVE